LKGPARRPPRKKNATRAPTYCDALSSGRASRSAPGSAPPPPWDPSPFQDGVAFRTGEHCPPPPSNVKFGQPTRERFYLVEPNTTQRQPAAQYANRAFSNSGTTERVESILEVMYHVMTFLGKVLKMNLWTINKVKIFRLKRKSQTFASRIPDILQKLVTDIVCRYASSMNFEIIADFFL